jgi:ComF family protein
MDLLYPRACSVCRRAADPAGHSLCWDCRTNLLLIHEPFCIRCGFPAAGSIDHEYVCHQCTERKPAFDAARSVTRYEGTAREMIHAFKYRKAFWLEDNMCEMLAGGARIFFHPDEIDLVCGVPLYPRRKRERGFNQADLLARGLARQLGLNTSTKLLRRTRETESQTRLTADARLQNVRKAFEVDKKAEINDLNVLVIDDVMTTGATVSECARVLKQAGAASVHVLTLARG